MRTEQVAADHPRTMRLPWEVAQGTLLSVLTLAEREGAAFAFDGGRGGPIARVMIGGRWVGYGDMDSVEFHRWPAIDQHMDEEAVCRLWHEQADATPTRAFCYFIGGAEGLIKIGYSRDPVSRLRALQAGSPIDLSILALREGGEAREAAYHHQFAKHRVRGEWFARTPEIEAEIARLRHLDKGEG